MTYKIELHATEYSDIRKELVPVVERLPSGPVKIHEDCLLHGLIPVCYTGSADDPLVPAWHYKNLPEDMESRIDLLEKEIKGIDQRKVKIDRLALKIRECLEKQGFRKWKVSLTPQQEETLKRDLEKGMSYYGGNFSFEYYTGSIPPVSSSHITGEVSRNNWTKPGDYIGTGHLMYALFKDLIPKPNKRTKDVSELQRIIKENNGEVDFIADAQRFYFNAWEEMDKMVWEVIRRRTPSPERSSFGYHSVGYYLADKNSKNPEISHFDRFSNPYVYFRGLASREEEWQWLNFTFSKISELINIDGEFQIHFNTEETE